MGSEPFRYGTTDPRNPALIRDDVIQSIQRYIDSGLPPGDFLEAVLANDLIGACKRADEDNLRAIVAIAQHVYSHVPMNCHGSKDLVRLWIALGSATRLKSTADVINKITEDLYEALGRRDA